MGLMTIQWPTAIDGITDHPGTTDHPRRHAALPARAEYNEFPENSGWSCQAAVLSHARHTIAKQRTYRTYRCVNSQKFDQRLTGNVIRKSINSVNYRLIESLLTSLLHIQADMKTAVFITSLSYNRTCLNRWVKFIWNMLKVILLNGRTIEHLLRCLYVADDNDGHLWLAVAGHV